MNEGRASRLTVGIAVLTHNRVDSLIELLDDLVSHLDPTVPIVVVDNASVDNTRSVVESRWPDRVRYVRNDENVGIVARNLGVSRIGTDIVVTLDDDVLGIRMRDLDRLIDQFEGDPALAGLNFRVVNHYSGRLCNWVHHRPAAASTSQFDTYEITEGAVAFRTAAFLDVGGYEPAYFISHEGPDLAFKLMRRGSRIAYDGSIQVTHKHEMTGRHPDRFYYYDTRNLFLLASRHMPVSYMVRYLGLGIAAMGFYALRDGKVRPWFRGVRDGLALWSEGWRQRQVWDGHTHALVKSIDRERPPLWQTVKLRLFAPAKELGG